MNVSVELHPMFHECLVFKTHLLDDLIWSFSRIIQIFLEIILNFLVVIQFSKASRNLFLSILFGPLITQLSIGIFGIFSDFAI